MANPIERHGFAGVGAELGDPDFSDIQVRLPGGKMVHAHRLLLAAASPVLRSKFSSEFRDSSESVWAPEVGSDEAWTWLMGWIYASEEPLPESITIEIIVLADHFEIQQLLRSVTAVACTATGADSMTRQILEVWACPDSLEEVARTCVPAAAKDEHLAEVLARAQVCNAVMFLKHVPVASEFDRLRMIQQYQEICQHSSLPDNWWLTAVKWHNWSGRALEAAHGGDLTQMSLPEGVSLRWSQGVQAEMQLALVRRCLMLEQHGGLASDAPGFIASCAPLSKPGIFAFLKKQGMELEVSLSSQESRTSSDRTLLFEFDTQVFGTLNGEAYPWVSVTPVGYRLRPCAVGLKHGLNADGCFCQSFAFEGRPFPGSEWQELLRVTGQRLSRKGTVFDIPDDVFPGTYFDSFRVRMVQTSTNNTWQLFLSWFDVFGHFTADLDWLNPKATA